MLRQDLLRSYAGSNSASPTNEINQFLKLLMLYRLVKESDLKDIPDYLPRIRSHDLAWLRPKKQQAKQKIHTLFSTQLMRPPEDRFGIPGGGAKKSPKI